MWINPTDFSQIHMTCVTLTFLDSNVYEDENLHS